MQINFPNAIGLTFGDSRALFYYLSFDIFEITFWNAWQIF